MLKVLLFAALFAASAFIVNIIYNVNRDKVSKETGDPELPTVSVCREGDIMNRMKGYKTKLGTRLNRDLVVPLDDKKGIEVIVEGEYSGQVKYELRDISGENLIENGEMELLGTANTDSSTGFLRLSGINSKDKGDTGRVYRASIRMDMHRDTEYSFVVLLKSGHETVRYYTRVVTLERDFLQQLISYAVTYNHDIFPSSSYDAGADDAEYSEKEKKDEKKSREEELWKDINPVLATTIVPGVREITSNTALIELKYIVKSPDNDAIVEYGITDTIYLSFDISNNKVKLQKSERSIEEIFASASITPTSSSERKHYTDNRQYIWSPDGRKSLFSLAGELWYYDSRTGSAARLFGCGSRNREEDYTFFNQSFPKLISVDNDGNAYFAVIGRMDHGKYEGRNGIFLYSYKAEKSEISLIFLVETDESYDALKTGAKRFVWFDQEKRELYTIIDNCLMKYDIKSGVGEELSAKMPQDMIAVSEDGMLAAFPDTDSPTGADEVILKNILTGEDYHFTGDGKKLRIIGFKGRVLVYGAAAPDNITTGSDGEPVFYFSNIFLVKDDGKISKDYSKAGIFVKDVELTAGDMKVTRVLRTEGRYQPYSDDHLTYKLDDNDDNPEMPDALYYRSSVTEMLIRELGVSHASAEVNPDNTVKRYYVFWDDGLKECFAGLGRAVVYAQSNGGIVTGSDGRMIYGITESLPYLTVAGKFDYVPAEDNASSLGACIMMSMKSAGIDTSGYDIKEASEEGYVETIAAHTTAIEGLNISGADTDTAIGFLSQGIPFTVKMPGGRYVLVVSYNSDYIRYYDPVQAKEIRTGRKSFSAEVEEAGSEIYVYK